MQANRAALEQVVREIRELRILLSQKEAEKHALEQKLGLTAIKRLGASIEHTIATIADSPA